MKEKTGKTPKHYLSEYPRLVEEYLPESQNPIAPEQLSIGMHGKVKWQCRKQKNHVWRDTIYHRLRGDGCPFCSGHRVFAGENDLATIYPEIAKKWDFQKNTLLPSEVRPYSNKSVFWKCKKGHSFHCKVSDMVRNNINCPYCYGRYPIKGETDLATLRPDLAAEWNYSKNQDKTPEEYTEHSNKEVWWKCKQGHEYPATIINRAKGKGCPYCSGRKAIPGATDLATLAPELVEEWDYSLNKKPPSEYTLKSNIKVHWVCHICQKKWMASISERSLGYGKCPECSKK